MMKRHLSNVFNTYGFEQQLRLTFSSGKAYKVFAEQIKNMADSEDVGAHEVVGVESARQLIKVGNNEYYIDGEQQSISKSFIYDPSEQREIDFSFKKRKRKIVFNVFHKNFGAVVETLPDYPVYIRFVFRLKDKSTQLNFSIRPEKATDVSSLVEAIETGLDYLEMAFEIHKSKKDIYYGIKNAISFWRRAKDIENIFKVKFILNGRTDADIYNLDKLYLLCKLNRCIKRHIEDFSQVLSKDEFVQLGTLEIGTVMALTWERDVDIELWGQKISVPCRYYIFDARLDEINQGKKNEYILYFKTTKDHPIQVIEMTKDTAGKRPMDMASALQKVNTAQTYADYVADFYKH